MESKTERTFLTSWESLSLYRSCPFSDQHDWTRGAAWISDIFLAVARVRSSKKRIHLALLLRVTIDCGSGGVVTAKPEAQRLHPAGPEAYDDRPAGPSPARQDMGHLDQLISLRHLSDDALFPGSIKYGLKQQVLGFPHGQ